MKRSFIILLVIALVCAVAFTLWRLASSRDPVEALVSDMVRIPGRDYLVGKYEVTQGQWEAGMGENPSEHKGSDHPVESVSWDDCQAFLERLNAHPAARASGLVFRLPTEDEWETSCRAGDTNDFCRLADGTRITKTTLGRVAWLYDNLPRPSAAMQRCTIFLMDVLDRVSDFHYQPKALSHQPVGQKEPNAYGLFDMYGNVWEWTDGRFDLNGRIQTANNLSNGTHRIYRGGGALDAIDTYEIFDGARIPCLPEARSAYIGFRICASSTQASETLPVRAGAALPPTAADEAPRP